jgi:topoisomerase IV subunit B
MAGVSGLAGRDTFLVDESGIRWRNSTHDWASVMDLDHVARIRRDPAAFAPGGVRHLVLEVVAYAAEEAERSSGGRCAVVLRSDGSVSVSDDGRGTDTGFDGHGRAVRKPVMATKDLRFFDFPAAQLLPDGHPRRGMSVVAALSEWLVHANHRSSGAWAQRYEHGVPVTDLVPVAGDGTTGTTVRFLPDATVRAGGGLTAGELTRLAASWRHLSVEIGDRRAG